MSVLRCNYLFSPNECNRNGIAISRLGRGMEARASSDEELQHGARNGGDVPIGNSDSGITENPTTEEE